MTKIAILIPVFNHLDYTKACLNNLDNMLVKAGISENFPVIVIDDGSTDGTSDWIKAHYPQVNLLHGNGNLWWSGGINVGARHAVESMNCDYVLLWNNDIQIDAAYFSNCLKLVGEYDDTVILGSKIYADPKKKTIWSMGGYFYPKSGKTGMHAFMVPESEQYQQAVEVDWITGMGTLVPARVMREIGYWDEKDFPQYHGDTEFTYRAKLKGFRNVIHPDLVIWNDITNTGLSHKDNFRTLLRLLSDKRSLYYLKVNLKFHKKYARSIFAYWFLVDRYFRLFGGFFKWKISKLLFGRSRES
ncbi:MAG: glycosyltransferase family 2 protein [Bacteroidales bacterium]|nr:glycosyltransferase family 2 protein [Bacteroidales bacterium]